MDRSDLLLNSMFQFSPEISINLTKMKNRDYYRLLMNKEPDELKANSKWGRDLQIDQTSLKTLFSLLKCVCKDNKLRELYFKLLHRILEELFLFGKAEDTRCPYCEMNDSIIHTFHSCNCSQLFFLELIKWLNKENATFVSHSPTELIFGIKLTLQARSQIYQKVKLHLSICHILFVRSEINTWRDIGK